MQIQIKARQTVILDGKYKGFNPAKPYVITITVNKQLESIVLSNKVKHLEYKKKTPKLRKARLGQASFKAKKFASGKIEYVGYKIPKNKLKIEELWVGVMIEGKSFYFK